MTALTWITRFADLAALTTDSGETLLKKRIITIAALIAPTYLFAIGVLYIYYGETLPGALYVFFAAYVWVNLFLFTRVHRQLKRFVWIIALPALPLHLIVALSLGSFINSGAIVLWGLAFPVVAGLIFLSLRETSFFFLLFIMNVIVTTILQPTLSPATALPQPVVLLIFALNVISISVFIMSIMAYFVRQRDVAFQLLRGEQVKAENLLLNVLPAEIAAILKNENRTIAEHFDGASILFADVVNFTPMSAQMTPVDLVNLLNEIFSYFDTLVEKYDLEKIKTIGDCYMVASGVPRPRPDHAQALIHMALEMQEYVRKVPIRGRQLSFRIGINSGPVVAGVIGRKKFIYDLWGDAVNTASRMESHGSGGAVQITEATYELIKDDFICEPRGSVHIKGKGEMEVWFVSAAKNDQPALTA